MGRNPHYTDTKGYPLCYGEDYEEDHDICVDCHVYRACGVEYEAAMEKQNARIKAGNLVQIGIPSQNPSIASYLDVTRTVTPTYPYQTYNNQNYSTPVSPFSNTATMRPTQQIVRYEGAIQLMKNPMVPNQFEGEQVLTRIAKNALIAATKMIALEIYRSIEMILGKWIWAPEKDIVAEVPRPGNP